MSKDPVEYLHHILDECAFIEQAISSEVSEADFYGDETLKRAIVRSLEIIGEATKQIPVDFKLRWHTIQWKNMAGMRDRLIHGYFGVNYFIVWDVVKNKIPALSRQIQAIIEAETP
jgi:uncharacterized protein with HEPN domain